jgi:hypothetical protein
VLAVLIAGVVLSTVYASYRGTFKISRSSEYAENLYEMMRITADRMLQDIESLTPQRYSYELKLTASDAAGGSGEIEFVSSAGLSYTDGRPTANARVRYYLTKESGEEGYSLWRSDSASMTTYREGAAPKGFLLCNRLKSIRYTFFDQGGEQHDAWSPGGAGGRPPASVMISFEFLSENQESEPYKFMTRIAIPSRG